MPNATTRPPLNPYYKPTTTELFCQDVFTLDEGTIVIQRPRHVNAADLEDIEEWIQLVVRGIRRMAICNTVDAASGGAADSAAEPGQE